MIRKFALAVFSLIMPFAVPAPAQSLADLEAKYPSVKAYEVRPGVLMTVKYAEDGQACEMAVERWHRTKSGVNLDPYLTDAIVKELINELVPVAERGVRSKFYGLTVLGGNSSDTNYNHENVTIHVIESISSSRGGSGNMILLISWIHRTCKSE